MQLAAWWQQQHGILQGAVVTAVGGAADFTVGAADAVKIIHWGAAQWLQRRTFGGFDMFCSAVMTAAAQDTAEGAVATAAGGTAGVFHSGAADAVRWTEATNFQRFSVLVRLRVALAAAAQDTAKGAVVMAVGGDSQ